MKREIHIWSGFYDAIGSRCSVVENGRRVFEGRRYTCADGAFGWSSEWMHGPMKAGPDLLAELEAARDRFFVRLGLGEVDATGQARGMRWASGSPVEVGHG